jgi:low temperature requirement protein LtrA
MSIGWSSVRCNFREEVEDRVSTRQPGGDPPHHHSRQMGGRDPSERDRVATPLELLFDLTFATCFGLAASQFAPVLADGRYAAAFIGFGFASGAICWAWISFSWFSSAYDTDDWMFRVVTMVEMIGVLVLAIGLPRLFASIEHGQRLDNSIMVLGYVVMRVALVFQWLRAATQDPARRRACLAYAVAISTAQLGWVLLVVVRFPTVAVVVFSGILVLIELAGPVLAERRDGGTPWHAHHIAERHSLFAIIALGEGVVGTVAALSAVVDQQGWTLEAALVGVAGTGLTFGMWWLYYLVPSAKVLDRHRDRAFVWRYGQMVIVTSIVATGGGLRVAALGIEGSARIGSVAAVLSVAIPLAAFLVSMFTLYFYLVRRFGRFDVSLALATAAVMSVAVVSAWSGMSTPWCLVLLMLAPIVSVVGYEALGYRRQADALSD